MPRPDNADQHIPIKVLVAIVFGVVGFGASLLVDGSNTHIVFSLSISLFVAGVAFVIQFLYEVEKRLDRMEDAYQLQADVTAERITDGFKKINKATELFGLVEASGLKTNMMTQLVRNSTRIEQNPVLLFEFAQAEISKLSDMLKSLSDGADVIYEGEDRNWMLGLTDATKSTIDATSLTTVDAGGRGFVDGGLWTSDLGQRYLDLQNDAMRRGVTIRRIFIMDRPDLLTDPDFVNVCQMHRDAGIQVRILDPSKISSTRRDSLFDFIIFDGVLSYQATPASRVGDRSRPVIVNTRLVTRPAAVAARIKRFNELWQDSAAAERISGDGDATVAAQGATNQRA